MIIVVEDLEQVQFWGSVYYFWNERTKIETG